MISEYFETRNVLMKDKTEVVLSISGVNVHVLHDVTRKPWFPDWPNITFSVHECCSHYCTTYCAQHTGCTGWCFPGLSGFETAEFTHTKAGDTEMRDIFNLNPIFLPDRYLARRSTYCQIILCNEESDLSEEGSKYRGDHHIQDVIQPGKVVASKM